MAKGKAKAVDELKLAAIEEITQEDTTEVVKAPEWPCGVCSAEGQDCHKCTKLDEYRNEMKALGKLPDAEDVEDESEIEEEDEAGHAAAVEMIISDAAPAEDEKLTINATSYDFITDVKAEEILAGMNRKYCCAGYKQQNWMIAKAGFRIEISDSNYVSLTMHLYYGEQTIAYEYSYFNGGKDISVLSFRKAIDNLLYKGFFNIPEYKKQLIVSYENEVNESLNDVGSSYIKIGVLLKKMRDDHLYSGSGDFYLYAEDRFGFKRSSVKNMIGIVEKFCIRPEGKYTPQLQDKYKNYSYSQLVEMLSMDLYTTLPAVTATVQELRDMKRKDKAGQTSGQNKAALPTPAAKTESGPAFAPADPELRKDNITVFPAAKLPAMDKVISFKNKDAREKFLKEYNLWPLWHDAPALNFKVYRCKLSDDRYLYAYELMHMPYMKKAYEPYCKGYHISKNSDSVYLDFNPWSVSSTVETMTTDKLSAHLPGSANKPAGVSPAGNFHAAGTAAEAAE